MIDAYREAKGKKNLLEKIVASDFIEKNSNSLRPEKKEISKT